jgi:hypothetical protein
MKIKVPAAVEVNELVAALKLSPTKSRNLAEKIYYFLSLLVAHNDNFRLSKDNAGYRNICSVQIKKVLGNTDYSLILQILLRPENPIIESNNSWHNPTVADKNGFCKGYRIVDRYNSGEVVFKTLSNRLSNLVSRSNKKAPAEIKAEYKFLTDKFEQHKLTIHEAAYNFVYDFGEELIARVINDNQYQIDMVYNLIGRWLYYLEKIEKKDLWCSVSSKNHRLSSSLTNLPRLLRQFILCDDQLLGMVDISSSQPYILSSIMSNSFFTDTVNGYNLSTIYPELYYQLIKLEYVSTNAFTSDNNYYSTYSGNTINNYIASITYNSFINNSIDNNINSSSSYSSSPSSSFMWCSFFTPSELKSISRYKLAPFDDDFYTYVIKSTSGDIDHSEIESQRQRLKSSFMFILFDDNQNHRKNNPSIQLVQSEFPGVDRWIREAHKVIGKTNFAHLLQRAESYLILKTVCKELIDLYPDIPIFTIHDAILCHPNHLPVVTSYLKNRLSEITGVDVGAKIKYPQIDLKPQIGDIEEIWKDIQPITTAEKFDKVSGGVFSSNVKRGSNFLKKLENF